ncbi:MAG: SigE family RNA polymerase sigma factor [Micromonosporaceae bacterium]
MRTDAEREYVAYVSGRLPALQRAAYLLCGDVHRAADLVQTTLTKLYVKWVRASRADNLDGYVHRILVRSFLDERRRGWARVALLGSVPERAAPVAPDAGEHADVTAALARLPERQRAALVLRFYVDLPVSQVAEILGCRDGTVKSLTSRGLAALRELLGGSGDAPAHDVPVRDASTVPSDEVSVLEGNS